MDHPPRGAFIVVEGLDKTGKTTFCTELTSRIMDTGVEVALFSFPSVNTPTGNLINDVVNGNLSINPKALALLYSANKWEVVDKIMSKIKKGINVICDSYVLTNLAYSVIDTGTSVYWNVQTIKGLPKPDLAIILKRPTGVINHVGMSEIELKKIGRSVAAEQFLDNPANAVIDADDICRVNFGLISSMVNDCWSRTVGIISIEKPDGVDKIW